MNHTKCATKGVFTTNFSDTVAIASIRNTNRAIIPSGFLGENRSPRPGTLVEDRETIFSSVMINLTSAARHFGRAASYNPGPFDDTDDLQPGAWSCCHDRLSVAPLKHRMYPDARRILLASWSMFNVS